MFVWTWVLLVLCVAGVVLALFSIVRLVPLALRLKRRVDALSESPLAASLTGLEMQSRRLTALQGEIAPLGARANAAVTTAKSAVEDLKIPRATAALQDAGAQISGLFEDLR
ncbi:MAG TPA: hypothetical protein VFL13_12745 [Candidatus Baltobacteraceae bacterium]|nr:hypothetical protein [Candidatus Baltobacteraceae bacterium]